MHRRSLGVGPSLFFLAALVGPRAAGAVEYVNDPLTEPSFPGRGSMGGSFSPNGWTVVGEPDSVWYEIPDALPSGRIEYSVTGLSLATSLTGADHDIFTMYQAPSGQPEPVPYSPYFRNNDFKAFTRIFGTQEPGRSGAMKLEIAFCPRGEPWYHDEACTPECDRGAIAYANGVQADVGWDAAATYRMAIDWSPGQMSFYRDGATLGTVAYRGDYAPQPLRIRLGSPRHDGVYPGAAFMPLGITMRDVLVTGTPGTMTPICGGEPPSDGGVPDAGEVPPDGAGALADVTAASWEPAVFSDVADLNVEAAGGTPTAVVYLRFPTVASPIEKAVLRLRTHDYPSAAGGSGVVCAVDDDSWSEDTMTWATRPPTSTRCAGNSVPVDVDGVVEWDVTALVAQGSPIDLAIVSSDDNAAHFRSKESGDPSFGPRLVVTAGAGTSTSSSAEAAGSGGAPQAGSSGLGGALADDDTGGTSTNDCACRAVGRSSAPPIAFAALVVPAAAFLRRRRRARDRSRSALP